MDAKGAALVIDQAARAEFRDRKKPCALEIGGLGARSAADGRHIGIERQPRKVVTGQEAFGREIAVGVEIRAATRRASFQQRELLVCLGLLDLRRSALFGAQAVHLRLAVCILQLRARALIKLPPTIEGLRELSCGSIGRRSRKRFPVRSPRCGGGRELGIDAVEDAPHRCRCPQLEIGCRERVRDLLLNRQGLGSQIEHVRDFGGQFLARFREPDRVQVGPNQVAVRQFERRRPHDAAYHRFGPLEIILVVRTLRRAIGHHESRLA